MPSLASVRTANAAFTVELSYRPVALFVGGTSGVGRGTAEAFARATKGNAHIILCGRSTANAESIIASFPKTPTSTYEFVDCDVSLMQNVVAATDALKRRLGTLNYLVLSQGVFTFQGCTPTAEGIDTKLALHFYSRWKFVVQLLPLLEKAKVQGQEARVMTILDARPSAPLLEDNLGLKKTYTLPLAAQQACTYNNIMIEEYSQRHPTLSFTHIYPGWVSTPITTT